MEEADAEVLELLAAHLEALVERRASSLAASCSQEVRGPDCCRPRPAWSGCAMREYLVHARAYTSCGSACEQEVRAKWVLLPT